MKRDRDDDDDDDVDYLNKVLRGSPHVYISHGHPLMLRDMLGVFLDCVGRADWHACYSVCKLWSDVSTKHLSHFRWSGSPPDWPARYWYTLPRREAAVLLDKARAEGFSKELEVVEQIYSHRRGDLLLTLLSREKMCLLYESLLFSHRWIWPVAFDDRPAYAIAKSTGNKSHTVALIEYAVTCPSLQRDAGSILSTLVDRLMVSNWPALTQEASVIVNALFPAIKLHRSEDLVPLAITILHSLAGVLSTEEALFRTVRLISKQMHGPEDILSYIRSPSTTLIYLFLVDEFGREDSPAVARWTGSQTPLTEGWSAVIRAMLTEVEARKQTRLVPRDDSLPLLRPPFRDLLDDIVALDPSSKFAKGNYLFDLYKRCL